jgi:hypothetical protein
LNGYSVLMPDQQGRAASRRRALALRVRSFYLLGLIELSTSGLGRKTRRQELIER